MAEQEIYDIEDIVRVCSSLSNERRILLLRGIFEIDGGSLQTIHQETKDDTGLSHRETTHKYLEELVESDILETTESSDSLKTYVPAVEQIRINLQDREK